MPKAQGQIRGKVVTLGAHTQSGAPSLKNFKDTPCLIREGEKKEGGASAEDTPQTCP